MKNCVEVYSLMSGHISNSLTTIVWIYYSKLFKILSDNRIISCYCVIQEIFSHIKQLSLHNCIYYRKCNAMPSEIKTFFNLFFTEKPSLLVCRHRRNEYTDTSGLSYIDGVYSFYSEDSGFCSAFCENAMNW